MIQSLTLEHEYELEQETRNMAQLSLPELRIRQGSEDSVIKKELSETNLRLDNAKPLQSIKSKRVIPTITITPSTDSLFIEENMHFFKRFLSLSRDSIKSAISLNRLKRENAAPASIQREENHCKEQIQRMNEESNTLPGDQREIYSSILLHYNKTLRDSETSSHLRQTNTIIDDIRELQEDPDYDIAVSMIKEIGNTYYSAYKEVNPQGGVSAMIKTSKIAQKASNFTASMAFISSLSGLAEIPATLIDAYQNYSEISELKAMYKEAEALVIVDGKKANKDLARILKLIKKEQGFSSKKYKVAIDLLKVGAILGSSALAVGILLVQLEVIVPPAGIPISAITAGVGIGALAIGGTALGGYLVYKGARKIKSHQNQKKWQKIAQLKGSKYEKLKQTYTDTEIQAMAHAKLSRYDPYYSMLVLHDKLHYTGDNQKRIEEREKTFEFLSIFGFNDALIKDIGRVSRNTGAYLIATKLGFNSMVAKI